MITLGVADVVVGAVRPMQSLPGGLAAGITGAVGIAILAVGLLLDVFVLRKLNAIRMGLATLVYFSGWLTTLEAFGARKWWTTMFPDPALLLLARLAGIGLLIFLTFGVTGLILNRVSPVGEIAYGKVVGTGDATKVKATGSAVGWAAVTAVFALSIPTGTWAASFTDALASPGTALANSMISAAVSGVGGGRR